MAKPKHVHPILGTREPNNIIDIETSYGIKRKAISPLEKVFNQGAREKLTSEIAKVFYLTCLLLKFSQTRFRPMHCTGR